MNIQSFASKVCHCGHRFDQHQASDDTGASWCNGNNKTCMCCRMIAPDEIRPCWRCGETHNHKLFWHSIKGE